MNNMPAWTPEMIGKLTPIQLQCMAHKRPLGSSMITEAAEFLDIVEREEQEWNKH